jgi:cytidyltransferase-like protein
LVSTVVVSGGFDDIRSRDIRFLEEAAKFGPVTVRLLPDAALGTPKFSFGERAYILESLRFVKAVQAADDAQVEFAGSVFVERERDATTAHERIATDQGLSYRVIGEAALEGFPEPAPKVLGEAKKVAVSGCYDWLHSGHVRFFEEASRLGALHVFLGSDATIRDLKGPGHPQFSEAERRYVVASVRHVFAVPISRGSGMLDFADDVRALRPDFFVVNEDGDKAAKREFCAKLGIEYLVLKRTPAKGLPARSSTDLRGF